ncbi:uncharacterized protein LOC109727979 isoform X2 [Ananas comosus]|uniref:Uncharacterized protein LOC109727979 isoform X2 n=1 Tax=Ananas comosus TaxID=4615 RepID=A0A6P5H197_ANACO|nr:uncharacterized protein LOC109727979 isoform X2 [Ananas comosus]
MGVVVVAAAIRFSSHPPPLPLPLPLRLSLPSSSSTLFSVPLRSRPILRSVSMASSSSASASVETSYESGMKLSCFDIVGENDLLIVGPGVLGRMVAEKWQQEHPGCNVYGQTMSTEHHNELTALGIIPSLRQSTMAKKVPYVIFCAPPSRTEDYPGDVRFAASNWSGEGSFLFTSSTAVYDCNDNGFCDEDSPVVPIGRSPRADVLLKAEKVVLEVGGCVLRLAGLYKEDRGAHTYWLQKGTVDMRPDHILNLIHYEDAASLSVAIMQKKLRGRIFLGCDNHPLSRQELMDCVNNSGKFSKKFEGFTGTNDPLGKRINNSKTRAEIGWEPKYPSFPEFLGLTN